MSYARWGEGDLYIFEDARGFLTCMWCLLMPEKNVRSSAYAPEGKVREDFTCKNTDEMLAHVRDHMAADHRVPERTIENLERDRADNDAYNNDPAAIERALKLEK